MIFIYIIIGIIAIVIISGIAGARKCTEQEKSLLLELQKLPNFNESEHIIGSNRENGIVFDYTNNKACLISRVKKQLNYRIVEFKDILSSEILEDGDSLVKTVRTSQIGGALIGGLALGAAGVIVGGLSGKKKSVEKVYIINIQIVINDTSNPTHTVNCFDWPAGLEKKDSDYKEGVSSARLLQSKIDVIINQVDEEDKAKNINDKMLSTSNLVADEIKKLVELRNSKILSETEFQLQKKKLLNH